MYLELKKSKKSRIPIIKSEKWRSDSQKLHIFLMIAFVGHTEMSSLPFLRILYLLDRYGLLLLLTLQFGQLLLEIPVPLDHAPQDHVVFRPVAPDWHSALDLPEVDRVSVHWLACSLSIDLILQP